MDNKNKMLDIREDDVSSIKDLPPDEVQKQDDEDAEYGWTEESKNKQLNK
jgi:hypothetical protein